MMLQLEPNPGSKMDFEQSHLFNSQVTEDFEKATTHAFKIWLTSCAEI